MHFVAGVLKTHSNNFILLYKRKAIYGLKYKSAVIVSSFVKAKWNKSMLTLELIGVEVYMYIHKYIHIA